MENFKVIIVEDVPLELKGTEGIFKNDIPEAEIIGTADSEIAYWKLIKQQKPDLVLLDLGLGMSFLKIPSVPFNSRGTSSTIITLNLFISLSLLFFLVKRFLS